MTKEEVLQFVSGNSKYRDIYEKILATDSLLSMQVMNEILKEKPQDPSALCVILDQVRSKYRSILGGGPSADELDLKKAKIFLLLKAALVDGSINDKENEALSQMVNAYEYRVPDLDVSAVAAQYNNGKAESILQEAKYGDRIRLLNSIDYIFKADGPLQKEEIGLMRELFSLFDIKPDAVGSFNFDPKRVYGIKLGSEEPAPQKVSPQKTGNGMSRDDILETTGRIRDLQVFHDILTSGTAGAERLYEAIADLNINNPMMLTSYLLQNKDELLVYCDDEASRVRTAKTALLMFAAAVDGRSEKKDALLTDIADNKIHVYNFEWNQATNWHDKKSEWSVGAAVNILSELPLEEKVEIYNDVVSIFEVDGGELSERKKQNLGYLRDDLGLDGNDDEEETNNEMDEGSGEAEADEVGEVKEDVVESEEIPAGSNTVVWTCPNCGQSGNTGNFCGECGTKRPDPAGPWTCPSCGHPGNKGKFCEECGEPRDNKKNKPSRPATETTPKPQTTPTPKPGEKTATINKVKADQNAILDEIDDERGVLLHVNFDIVNCKGIECVCGAWLFRADGTKVKATVNRYAASDGQVADVDRFTPNYDNTHFDDFQLFIPYSQFSARKKEENYYLIIQVQTSTGIRLSSRYQEHMTLPSDIFNGVDPSFFSEIRFDDYDSKELRITAKLADNPNLNQPGEIRVWIHWPNGNMKWNKKAEPKYKTKEGFVSVNRRFVSGSAELLTRGIGLSLPYEAMYLQQSITYGLKFRVGIRFDGEEDWTYSDFVDFKIDVKKGLFSTTYRLVK